jgi:uncharacterized protein (TIGR02147 family)
MLDPQKPDPAAFLRVELATRRARNARYSLRAFARDVGVDHGFLSRVLAGKRPLTVEIAQQAAERLGFDAKRTKMMVLQATAQQAPPGPLREEALAALEALAPGQCPYAQLELDRFRLMTRWYHLALAELVKIEGIPQDPAYLARRLGVSQVEVELAIERLQRLQLVEIDADGRLRRREPQLATGGTPAKAVREYHRSVLALAERALDQDFETRDHSAITMPVDADKLPAVRDAIRNFRREMARLASGAHPDRIYQLSVQLFRLDRDAP